MTFCPYVISSHFCWPCDIKQKLTCCPCVFKFLLSLCNICKKWAFCPCVITKSVGLVLCSPLKAIFALLINGRWYFNTVFGIPYQISYYCIEINLGAKIGYLHLCGNLQSHLWYKHIWYICSKYVFQVFDF